MTKVPKYIKDKAKRAEKLAREAACLVYEIEKWIEKKGIMYMPTWHPAALLRDETKKIEFLKDLKQVTERNY